MNGLGWPQSRLDRARPRAAWLRYVLPGSAQMLWIGTAHPRLLATLYALEGPAEFGQWVLAAMPHREVEIVVLRATWNAGHSYHYAVHALYGAVRERRGFLPAIQHGPDHSRWNARQSALLRAVDELHDQLAISPLTVRRLRELGYTDRQLIEICFITAHYQLIAMLMETAGMPSEPLLGPLVATNDELPRRPRTGANEPAAGLNPSTPWNPGGDDVLTAHRFLHYGLNRYGRAMANLSTVDPAEIGAALDRSALPPVDLRAAVVHRAVIELDREFFLTDDTWKQLREYLTVRQIMELCVLVGHYRTFEMIVNTLHGV